MTITRISTFSTTFSFPSSAQTQHPWILHPAYHENAIFPFNKFLSFQCLLDTNKGFCWRSGYWLNPTQGARSHPVTDARDLRDNELRGMERTVGWMLLKLQHYWVISPSSLLEHKNEEQFWRKTTHKGLEGVGSHHETLLEPLINGEVKILDHFLCHGLCSEMLKFWPALQILPKIRSHVMTRFGWAERGICWRGNSFLNN